MEIVTKTIEKVLEQTVSTMVLRDDIALLNVVKKINGEVSYTDSYCIPIHPDNITDAIYSELEPKKDEKYTNLVIMKKEFVEEYAKTGFPLNDFYDLYKKYSLPCSAVFYYLSAGTITLEDLVFVEFLRDCAEYYPFVYGETKSGFFPHFVKYDNVACYMVKSSEYDFPTLIDFLNGEAKNENIKFMETKGSSFVRKEKDKNNKYEFVYPIPSYNLDEDPIGTRYVNFVVYVDTIEKMKRTSYGQLEFYKNKMQVYQTSRL